MKPKTKEPANKSKCRPYPEKLDPDPDDIVDSYLRHRGLRPDRLSEEEWR